MTTIRRHFTRDEDERRFCDKFEVTTDEGDALVVPVLWQQDPTVPDQARWFWGVYHVTPLDDPTAQPVPMLWRRRGDTIGSFWVNMTEYEFPKRPWTEPIAHALRVGQEQGAD